MISISVGPVLGIVNMFEIRQGHSHGTSGTSYGVEAGDVGGRNL